MEIKSFTVLVKKDRYFLSKTMQTYTHIIVNAANDLDGKISLVQFRDLTILSRNRAIEVLEYFDKTGVTRRIGDSRVINKDF